MYLLSPFYARILFPPHSSNVDTILNFRSNRMRLLTLQRLIKKPTIISITFLATSVYVHTFPLAFVLAVRASAYKVGCSSEASRLLAPSETSQTLVSILGDQCTRVQNPCSVTNSFQSLVFKRVFTVFAHGDSAVRGELCADNMDIDFGPNMCSVTAKTAHC